MKRYFAVGTIRMSYTYFDTQQEAIDWGKSKGTPSMVVVFDCNYTDSWNILRHAKLALYREGWHEHWKGE